MSTPDSLLVNDVNICSHQDTIITLTNPFCDSLFVINASLNTLTGWRLLEADGSNKALALPIFLGAGEKKKILVRFTPSSIGKFQTTLLLTLHHNNFFKDTSLSLRCGSYRTTTVIALDSIDVGTISICSLADTNIIIRNIGCETLRIDSIILSGSKEFSIKNGFTVSNLLSADSSITIPIRYLPQKGINSIAKIVLYYNATGDSLVFPLSLHGKGIFGSSTFVSSNNTPLYTFTARTICDKGDSLAFRINNIACDTTQIITADFATSSPSVFTSNYQSLFPYNLEPTGNAYVITVKANPTIIGKHTASYHLQYRLSDSTIKDTTYLFECDVTRGTRIMNYNLSSIDLGTNALCDERDTVMEMVNVGCDSVRIKSIVVSDPHYSIIKSTNPPFTLLPGAKDSLLLRYTPSTFGLFNADLRIESNADNDSLVKIPLSVTTLDKDYVGFRLESPNKNLIAGDTFKLNVIPNLNWTKKGVKILEFDLAYNGDLFTYIAKYHSTLFTVDTAIVSIVKGKTVLHVTITSNLDIPMSKDQALLLFIFYTRLTDTLTSSLQLSNFYLNSGDQHYKNCILSASTQDTSATLTLLCGEDILYRFLRSEPLLHAGTITPNPVTHESNYIFSLPYTYNAIGELHVEIIGSSGEVYLSQNRKMNQAGRDAFILDLSKLPSGTYEYVLRSNEKYSSQVRGRVLLLK